MASLYGAMLAGVDYVIMGAGIPMQIPGILDTFVNHGATQYRVDVVGAEKDAEYAIHFDPAALFPGLAEQVGPLPRPDFLPVVSSLTLARALKKRASGEVNGFVVELPTAGGHNAPPRGDYDLNERGEPVYTKRDDVDPSDFGKLGLPYWLAGGYGSPEGLQAALDAGAAGVQVGTAFAYCEESGMDPALTAPVIEAVLAGNAPNVLTSARVSPTGFPFKVVGVPGTAS
jgi:nitronate monooxygenase